MGIGNFLKKVNGFSQDDDPNSSGDKHLDYLRREAQRVRNENEKRMLRARLQAIQKSKFKKMVSPTMSTGKFKKKKFNLKL